ncbi:23S rRNA accumulation protein YceD [Neptunicella marina]|uniref:Large ribosomal RNA subunit accumulation protein YceD n=1 Tax=Neptunicella marina TaxID=2125989 RepID=A0A8J6J1I7_9ALTE|nr:23S rRNA accumulation protein YceD [Neptunicella marina]MBC3767852.1 23S rRNA accumulation protein YceD [Neptunicella marina]
MQKAKLPLRLDPVKSASKRSNFEGIMLCADMERLQQMVSGSAEHVDVQISFETDVQGLNVFSGKLKTQVELVCQRCYGNLTQDLNVDFTFSAVKEGDDLDELPDVYEPVEVDDHGEIDLLQLIEDELILSLPIVALHDEQDCNITEDEMSYGKIEPADERPNPFAVLKELKRD